MILIIYGHPYPHQSRINHRLLDAVRDLQYVQIRELYQLYPDFDVDIPAEHAVIEQADLVILQHPMRWYSMPALMKEWIDRVFSYGWAYGEGGIALQGKTIMWAVTAGGSIENFNVGDFPGIAPLAQPLQATASYCGMEWHPPFTLLDAHLMDDETLTNAAIHYRQLLEGWENKHHG